jgi:methionine synthase II (cobalamin-independent)
MTPWPPGAATGIGSLPGTDIDEALRIVFGELPDLPHLPELPDRGAGADMIGRGATFLAELPVEIQPSGWRLTSRPGHDLRRARDFLERDLDALEAAAQGYAGTLKLQVAGPWTLAAGVELHSGHRVVADHGATRELAQSLAEGLRAHLADVTRRVPAATIVTQFDEPSIPAVLGGRVPTPSGYGTVRAIEASVVEQTLSDVLAVVPLGQRVVHCCAADVPITLLRSAGADAISLDASYAVSSDVMGEAVEAGASLWLGVVPGTDASISLEAARDPVRKLWRELGFAEERLATSVVPTPACGLAGASPAYARRALSIVRDVGRSLRDLQA